MADGDSGWIDRTAKGNRFDTPAADFDPDQYLRDTARKPNVFDQFDRKPGEVWPGRYEGMLFNDLIPSYGSAESGLEGYLKGASANWRDEVYGASKASGLPDWLGGFRAPVGAARLAYEHYIQPQKGLSDIVTGKDSRGLATREYERARDEKRREEAEMQRQHPFAFGVGELGGAAASMLAAPEVGLTRQAVARLGPVAGRIAGSAAAGAGYGALAGAGEGEGAAGTAAGAVTGGLTGAALGTVGAGLTEAATPVIQKAISTYRGLRSPDDEALRRIALAAERDAAGRGGQTLTPAEIQYARNVGIPLGVVDVGGETMRALARSAANTSPEARSALTEFTQERFQTQSPRVAGFIREITGGADAAGDLEAIQDAARRFNRPAYRAAYATGEDGLWTPELERLAGSPAVRRAMENAVERGRDRAVADGFGAFNPGVTFENGIMRFGRGKGAPPYPNMQFWDYTQRELRDMASAASRAGHNEQASAIGSLQRQLLAELDSANPQFQLARSGAAGFFGADNALEAGHKFAVSSISSPKDQLATRRAIARMSTVDRELFARGYASRLADMVERAGDNRNVLNAAFFNSGAARQRTQIALGPGRAQQLEAMLRIERLVDRSRTALGNSTTARQLAELGMAGGFGAGYGILEGDFNPFHMGAASLAGLLLHRGNQYINQRVAERVGQLLASNRPADLARGAAIAARDASIMNRLRQLTGAVAAGAGTEAVETSGNKPRQGLKHGGALPLYFDAPPERQGRASGGRVPGELPPSQKASHEEVGYVAKSPRAKQHCIGCTKYILSMQGGPACKKVKSPVASGGWCRRFSLAPELRDVS